MCKFSINGVDLELDAFDLDTAEQFAAEKRAVGEKLKAMQGEKDGLVVARAQCKAVKAFFDHMFGPDKGIEICGEKDNLRVCAEAYAAVLTEDNRQGQEFMRQDALLSLMADKSKK